MKRPSLIFLLIPALLMVSCIKDDIRGADLKVGDSLPDFEVVMSDGTTVSDDSLKGSVSVIVFFSTICPDCQQILPVIQEIYEEYAPEGAVFALISREQDESNISTYWADNALYMPYSAQQDRRVYEKFAKAGIPRIYINDKDGTIRYIYTDDPVPSYSELELALDELLGLFL
jgi:peroxiredoxin